MNPSDTHVVLAIDPTDRDPHARRFPSRRQPPRRRASPSPPTAPPASIADLDEKQHALAFEMRDAVVAGRGVVLSIGKLGRRAGELLPRNRRQAASRTTTSDAARRRAGGSARMTSELGLDGRVSAEDLRQVLAGVDPTSGERFARGGEHRVPGFDLTFCAPKSVSVLWGLGDRDISADGTRRARHQRRRRAAVPRGPGVLVATRDQRVREDARRRIRRRRVPASHEPSRRSRTSTRTSSSRTRPAARTAGGERSTRATSTCTPRPPAISTRPNSGPSSPVASASPGHRSSTASPTSTASPPRCSNASRLGATRSRPRWPSAVSARRGLRSSRCSKPARPRTTTSNPSLLRTRWTEQAERDRMERR